MAENESAERANAKIAVELQNKYQFYFLGLTFTLLALAVQTSKFGPSVLANGFELAGWASLLVAGLTALSHFEWAAPMYRYHSWEAGAEHVIDKLKQVNPRTTVQNTSTDMLELASETLERKEESLAKLRARRKRLERWQRFRYRLMKLAFIAGILCLMVSRAWTPLQPIAKSVTSKMDRGSTVQSESAQVSADST